MKKTIREYFRTLKSVFDKIIATGRDTKIYKFDEAIDVSMCMIVRQVSFGGKLFFIGNGAGASIASHMATDFWKNAGIRALCFNDSSLLTCISNDYGYSHVFEKPIEAFAESNDILIAISSSGKSENILRAVSAAKKRRLKIITLSGFNDNNPLRRLGDMNFYVPLASYGHVETAHLSICHSLVDLIIKNKSDLMKRAKR